MVHVLVVGVEHLPYALCVGVLYARKSAKVAVVGGMGRWGLMVGTGWRIGLFVMSRTGVLESTSTRVSRAAK